MQDTNKYNDIDFHGAAILDSNGRELPITEEMVQTACSSLDEQKESEEKAA